MYNGIKHVARKGEKGRGRGVELPSDAPSRPGGRIEQLEDGPLCRYKVTEDCLLNFLRASPLPAPYSAPAMAAPSFGDMAERNIVDLPSAGCRIE